MTDVEAKDLIVKECNLAADTDLPGMVDKYWSLNYDTNEPAAVVFLRTKLSTLNYVLGTLRLKVDISIGSDKFAANQLFKNVLSMLAETRAQLDSLSSSGSSTFGITATSAGLPNAYGLDEVDLTATPYLGGHNEYLRRR